MKKVEWTGENWPEVREAWLENLRSGEIKQGPDHLNRNGQMCCLGVLCETVGFASKLRDPLVAEFSYADPRSGAEVYKDMYTMVNPNVFPPLEKEYDKGPATPKSECRFVRMRHELANMNDAGHDFFEIADFIEEHL